MRRSPAAITAGIALALVLSACGTASQDSGDDPSAPDATPASAPPTPTATSVPDETPAPEATVPETPTGDGENDPGAYSNLLTPALVIDSYGAVFVNADHQQAGSVALNQDAKKAAPKLGTLLGVTPTVQTDSYGTILSYDFGGLRLIRIMDTLFLGRRYTFEVTAESVHGVHVYGPTGWRVGDAVAPLLSQVDNSYTDSGTMYLFVTDDPNKQLYLQSSDGKKITSFTYPEGT
jgi:hypothetical protein